MSNKFKAFIRAATIAAATAGMLPGCGGGGGDGGATARVASTATFPLQAGYRALLAAGSSSRFTISGDCGGTATETTSRPSAATFEGAPAQAVTATVTMSLTGCLPASSATSAVFYYATDFTPLGSEVSGGGEYVVYEPGLVVPATVKVGDTAVIGQATKYASRAKTTVAGTEVLSYVVAADTANTALVTLITRDSDASGRVTATAQTTYRISADGALTRLSMDVATPNIHVVLTAQ